MRKTITTIFTLAAMLFATSANAQKEFVYEFQSYVGDSYENYTQVLDVEAIEAELGCTLAEATIYAVQSDGTLDPDYTLGPGGATTDGWRNAAGDWEVWSSSGSCFCVKANFTPEPDEEGNVAPHFYYIGGKSGQTSEPVTYAATYRLENPANTSKFCFVILKLSYIPEPEFEITTKISELNIVGRAELVAEQYPRTNTNGVEYKVQVGDLAKLLGYEAEDFNAWWYRKMVFVGYVDESDVKSEDVTNLNYSTTAWMNSLFDENTGNETKECVQGSTSEYTKFWVHLSSSGYDGDTLKVQIGQRASKLKIGDEYYTYLYFIKGNNAFELKVTLSIIENPEGELSWDEKKLVGSETITLESNDISSGAYDAQTVAIDLEAILALFPEGTDVSDLKFVAIDSEGNPTDSYSTNTTGFWMDMESHPSSWSTFYGKAQGYYCDYATDGTLTIGHIPGQFNKDEIVTTTGSLFLVCGNYKYEFVMNYSVNGFEKEVVDDPLLSTAEILAIKYEEMQIIPNSTYKDDYMDAAIDLDINFIEQTLGTRTIRLWGQKYSETNGFYSSDAQQSMDGCNQGFWMDVDTLNEKSAVVGTWSSAVTNAYGIGWRTNGTLTFFQYPGQRKVGDEYNSVFYLATTDKTKAIKINLNVKYVEEIIPEATTLETFSLTLPARDPADKDNGMYTAYDLSPMYKAFGCTPEEFEENGTWMAIDADGDLTSNYDELEGFAFDANGRVTDDDAALVAKVGYIPEEGAFFSWILDDVNLANTYNVIIYAYYDNQRCIFTITVGGEAEAINFVELNKSDSKMFDLTGRLVKNATKGFYIKDGKKFLVK
ncbi:MAG: DUF4859 domain-containing protein [Bacteroidaceae bacterium]|nr:DUF4859 domain-containing protein [Bacteroidaceae bacterium]